MNWFFIALVAPLLWAFVNHIDKHLLSRYLKVEGPGPLMIFSSLAGAIVLPFAFFFYPDIFNISTKDAAILLAGGVFSAFAVFFYFKALFQDEATNVVPLFQTIPVFGLFLSYFILDEIIPAQQIVGSVVIVVGAIYLSIEKVNSNKYIFSLRNKSTLFMLFSSFLYAVYGVLFKFVAVKDDFWLSIFWQNLGLFIVGLFFSICIKKYRKDFLSLYKINGNKLLGINLFNETLTLVGNIIFSYAILLAPVALVMTVGGYQPIFVLIIGLIIARFTSSEIKEDISKDQLLRKVISIALITLGSILTFF